VEEVSARVAAQQRLKEAGQKELMAVSERFKSELRRLRSEHESALAASSAAVVDAK
jgi:hypothetical protein